MTFLIVGLSVTVGFGLYGWYCIEKQLKKIK